jgi:phosphopantothenoylcysteine decarboxylase/phosphopantothenate--cysteine ligase
MAKGRILFQLSGSIAAFKACAAISRLAQEGYEVQAVATANALRFVGTATLEGLTGREPMTDTFAPGRAMQHIEASKWADVAVLCPASASAINKLAAGIGDDLLSTLFLAHDFAKPYLIVPAMNEKMYLHPATQSSLEKLKSWGVRVLEPAKGAHACGDAGWGRLLEPEAIALEVALALSGPSPGALNGPSPTALRVLVTSGGTQEPIDSVRSIANFSTGRTGAAIASFLAARGHNVTLLKARHAAAPAASSRIALREFAAFAELEAALRSELRPNAGRPPYAAVVHAAAVGDYAIERVEDESGNPLPLGLGKASSSGRLTLRLRRQPKLVAGLRDFAADPRLTVVAFKLTSGASAEERAEAVGRLARDARPDFIVHNDLMEIASHGSAHASAIYGPGDGQGAVALASCSTKEELARALERFLLAAAAARKAST